MYASDLLSFSTFVLISCFHQMEPPATNTSGSNSFSSTISSDLSIVYAFDQVQKYAQDINNKNLNNNNNNKSSTVYSGISTTDLLKQIPELQEFFQHKQAKYNRRRDPTQLKQMEDGLLPRKNIVQYVIIFLFCLI